MINENITELKKLIIEYSTHIEGMMRESLCGLFNRDNEPLQKVIEVQERSSNIIDLHIEDKAINIVAKFQPMALNLRMIIGIMKMSNSLERIGDHCVNISKSALFLNKHPQLKPFIDLPKMKETVMVMLGSTSKSLVELDVELARKVYEMDDVVDEYKRTIKLELIEYMEKDSSNIKRAVELLNISNNLERIADLITNMCEDIIYIKDGEIIRHQAEK
ncbi:phosphate transport system protein [Elusimicrobium posterum]|uniref:phosphate signaling complex protein PhoU n=1 Tax=Elusimicrobium posterum TaxID=3116653 RepID=UPI003C7560BE